MTTTPRRVRKRRPTAAQRIAALEKRVADLERERLPASPLAPFVPDPEWPYLPRRRPTPWTPDRHPDVVPMTPTCPEPGPWSEPGLPWQEPYRVTCGPLGGKEHGPAASAERAMG